MSIEDICYSLKCNHIAYTRTFWTNKSSWRQCSVLLWKSTQYRRNTKKVKAVQWSEGLVLLKDHFSLSVFPFLTSGICMQGKVKLLYIYKTKKVYQNTTIANQMNICSCVQYFYYYIKEASNLMWCNVIWCRATHHDAVWHPLFLVTHHHQCFLNSLPIISSTLTLVKVHPAVASFMC